LRAIWRRWQRAAKKVAEFQARLLLSLFYFLVLAPFALVLRLASDPLELDQAVEGWHDRDDEEAPANRAREQY
jgi:hypothetical protein